MIVGYATSDDIYSMTQDPQVLLYGEQDAAEEDVCDDHGCRLSFHPIMGKICMECIREARYEDLEELREAHEREEAKQEAMMDEAMLHGTCTIIQTEKYTAFNCVMPWWA